MKRNIIAFSGAHGTGKTTSVFELATAMKKAGRHVGVILEAARECPFPVMSVGCAIAPKHSQLWIYNRQMMCEIEASEKYDVVISDRTLIDCIGYTRYAGYDRLANSMALMLTHHSFRYHRIYFKSIMHNDYCTHDGFRSTDLGARDEIENVIYDLYEFHGIEVIQWTSHLAQNLTGIANDIVAG